MIDWGFITPHIAITRAIFAILLPIMFPVAISAFPLTAAFETDNKFRKRCPECHDNKSNGRWGYCISGSKITAPIDEEIRSFQKGNHANDEKNHLDIHSKEY